MMTFFFGTLTDARKKKWNNGEDNPYDVVKENVSVGYNFFYQYCFRDEIWIDWESKAGRVTGRVLLDEMRKNGHKGRILKGIPIRENEEYGFVEMEEC